MAEAHSNDAVLPFAIEKLDVRGRTVRLGDSIDTILTRHDYPPAVARAVGEAAALTTLLGTALKFEGCFQLQTRTDGIVSMIVVDFDAPDRLRACATFDAQALERALAEGRTLDTAALLGKGHLGLTIDQGPHMSRYQGIVALEGQGLEDAAHHYFRQSEQIPTRIRLAVGEEFTSGGEQRRAAYRAGGVMVQYLPGHGTVPAAPDDAENDGWREARLLVETVEDHELIDSTLSSERLLYRLFHEHEVRVFDAQSVHEECRCTRERIVSMLGSFSMDERQQMIGDNGRIGVTCEFCSRHYDIELAEAGLTVADGQ